VLTVKLSTTSSQQENSLVPQNSIITIESINVLAHQLIEKFADVNLLAKEKSNVFQAVNNTLKHLQVIGHHQALQLLQQHDLKTAVQHLMASVEQEEKSREAAKIWVDIGNLQQLQSSQHALLAYKKASQLDDKNSNAWNRLGHYYRHQKQFTLAKNAYKKVLASSKEGTATQAVALANFGLLYQAEEKLVEAESAYLKALKINEVQNNAASLASNNENLAIIYKKNNNFASSEKHYLAALSFYKTLNETNSIASIQQSLASLYHREKKFTEAEIYYKKAVEIYKKNDNKKKIASSYSKLGVIYQQKKQIEAAKILFEKSLNLNQQIKQPQGIADQYGNLGVIYRLQRKFNASEASHLNALQRYQQLQQTDGVSQQQTNLGFLYQAWGKTKQACHYWQQSKTTLQQLKNISRVARIEDIIKKQCQQQNIDDKTSPNSTS
jgi:tetratricopeptide (TPR) repeat protein